MRRKTVPLCTFGTSGDADATNGVPVISAIALTARVTGEAADTALKPTDDPVSNLAGWTGKMYSLKPKSGPEDVAVVYSDIGEPTRKDASDQTATALGLASNARKIASSAFSQTGGTKSHAKATATTPAQFKVRGTFDGGPGIYTCTAPAAAGNECTSTVSGTGFILGGTGQTWSFTADPGSKTSVPDSSYLAYGWWLRKAESGYLVATFVIPHGTLAPEVVTTDYTDPPGLGDLLGRRGW